MGVAAHKTAHGHYAEDHDHHSKGVAGLVETQRRLCSLSGHIDHIERALYESADRHSEELQAVKGAQGMCARELEGLKDSYVHRATIEQRFNHLEKIFAESAAENAVEVAALKAAHGQCVVDFAKHAKDVAGPVETQQHCGSLSEHPDYIERAFCESADKHSE